MKIILDWRLNRETGALETYERPQTKLEYYSEQSSRYSRLFTKSKKMAHKRLMLGWLFLEIIESYVEKQKIYDLEYFFSHYNKRYIIHYGG